MIVDRKPLIYVWEPLYRVFFRGLLWPLVRKVGGIAFAPTATELNARLDNLQERLDKQQDEIRRLRQENESLRALVTASVTAQEQKSSQQWSAIEQLLVCILRERGPDE